MPDPPCHPRMIVIGRCSRVRLPVDGSVRRVRLIRGRSVVAEVPVESNDEGRFFEIEPDVSVVRGLHHLVLIGQRDSSSKVLRDAVSFVEENWLSSPFPKLPEYDRWHYLQDAEGIPLKDVGGRQGYVRHPLVATYFAQRYADMSLKDGEDAASARVGFHAIVRWLESISRDGPEDSLLVPHDFPLAVSFRLDPGWISGLTQGRVAEVFLRAADLDDDPRYRELARRCCLIMRVPTEHGGLLARDRFGCCAIEEYATRPASWAINGIGSAVHSLEALAERVDLPWAGDLIDDVCRSVERKIHLFDVPDAPGSRVQLALRYEFELRARSLFGRRQTTLGLLEVEIAHHAEPPTRFSGADAVMLHMDDAPVSVHGASAVAVGGRIRFQAMIDANRDPFDGASDPSTNVRIRLESSNAGIASIFIKGPFGTKRLLRVRLAKGRQDLRFTIDAMYDLPSGVGRTARWNETYHTTNLAWMWALSRYGRQSASTLVARRWLLSLHTGVGRVPLDPARCDLSELQRLREELVVRSTKQRGPVGRSARMQIELIDELERWRDGKGLPLRGVHVLPSRCPASHATSLSVYGFPFGSGTAVLLDGRPVEFRMVSADEIVVTARDWTVGRHVLRVVNESDGSFGDAAVEVLAEGGVVDGALAHR